MARAFRKPLSTETEWGVKILLAPCMALARRRKGDVVVRGHPCSDFRYAVQHLCDWWSEPDLDLSIVDEYFCTCKEEKREEINEIES